MLPTYPADPSATCVARFGGDNRLARTIEYAEKLVASRDYVGNEIEAFIALSVTTDGAAAASDGVLRISGYRHFTPDLHRTMTARVRDGLINDGGAIHWWVAERVGDIGVIRPI